MSKPDPITRRDMLRGRWLTRLIRAARGESEDPSKSAGATPAPRPNPHSVSHPMRFPATAADLGTPIGDSRSREGALRHRSIPVFRPPGAIQENRFLAECTRCGDCAAACPHDAIVPAPPRFREGAGFPMIDPDHQPCRWCADFPCIAACEPNALSNLIPKALGTARITRQTCLAHQGTTCTVCSEQCPVEGAIVSEAGKPRVIEDNCTGCGVCRYVCPAPENAILLMPAFVRPFPDASGERTQ